MVDHLDAGLYSIVLTLTPTRATTVRATMGHQVHAAFLQTVRESDATLAEVLHLPDLPARPFTVSPLMETPRAYEGRLHLTPEETYWLRFTVLYPPIFERFMTRFLRGEGRPIIRLGDAILLIREILTTPEGHPWAGYSSWGRLAAEAQPARELTLDFVTPTAFGFGQQTWGKKMIVLPAPEPVFDSLARAWNMFAPAPLQVDREALRAYLAAHVVVKRLENVNTQMLAFSRAPQVGFVGRVTYGLMGDNDIARAQLTMLADFAFYSGVGYKTTMGMGQARRVKS
ncbi:MAG TPA: CRISPR-associated endoribonuclease Cas6 [Anaerolineae bacterium]|nr:CRISPR-associated endoribonuclease Cas6 [Anaerolineae bacterium]